jgi:hypothetical protein
VSGGGGGTPTPPVVVLAAGMVDEPILHLMPDTDLVGMEGILPIEAALDPNCDPELHMQIGCDIMAGPVCNANWLLEAAVDGGTAVVGQGLVGGRPEMVTADAAGVDAFHLTITWSAQPGPVVVVDPRIGRAP